MISAYTSQSVELMYRAKGKKTGLTDVIITIIDVSDGTKVVDSQSMEEVSSTNAPGIYRYTWSPSSSGTYLAIMKRDISDDSPEQYIMEEMVYVIGGTPISPISGIVTADDVRAITSYDITTSDLSDDELNTLIAYAIAEFNNDVGVRIIEEEVSYIDQYRKNEIDGSNKTFYVQSSFLWYLGDLNNDGNISTADVEVWVYDSADDTRTKYTVSEIDEIGKVILSKAPPSTSTVKITYLRVPLPMSDALMKKAICELSAHYAYMGLDAREKKRVNIRGFSIARDPRAAKDYYNRYLETLARINARHAVLVGQQKDTLKKLSYLL